MTKVVREMTATDKEYLKQAYAFAAEHSPDPSTQNGAILVDATVAVIASLDDCDIELDGPAVAYGANRFPRGVEATKERLERPLKYSFICHAERDVIYDAAKHGVATEGLTMYCPWYACTDCARAIIQSGITEVIGHRTILDKTPDRWKETIDIALGMLDDAGVKNSFVGGEEGELDAVGVRFNGEIWYP